MIPQVTLAASTPWVRGPVLGARGAASLRLHPAAPDEGIVFVRSDLPGEPRIPVELATARPQPRWSSVERDGVWVHLTEHVLAAVGGLGIDNVLVEVDREHTPVAAGGSCAAFTPLIRAAGVRPVDAPRWGYRVCRTVARREAMLLPDGVTPAPGGRQLVAFPDEGLGMSYVFHLERAGGARTAFAELEGVGERPFAPFEGARTYVLGAEHARVAAELGELAESVHVVAEDGPQAAFDEIARHKLVDLLGDLMLLGRPVAGRFAAIRTGHRFHQAFVRQLHEEGALERFEFPSPS